MPFELSKLDDKKLLQVRYHGVVTMDERIAARDEVFRLCREGDYYRVLVDTSGGDVRMTPQDAIKFANAFQRAGLPSNYRLAVVVGPGNDLEKLVETMLSMDLISIRHFSSQEAALRWLEAL